MNDENKPRYFAETDGPEPEAPDSDKPKAAAKPYDAALDVTLRDLGSIAHGGATYEVAVKSYDGSEPRVTVARRTSKRVRAIGRFPLAIAAELVKLLSAGEYAGLGLLEERPGRDGKAWPGPAPAEDVLPPYDVLMGKAPAPAEPPAQTRAKRGKRPSPAAKKPPVGDDLPGDWK